MIINRNIDSIGMPSLIHVVSYTIFITELIKFITAYANEYEGLQIISLAFLNSVHFAKTLN